MATHIRQARKENRRLLPIPHNGNLYAEIMTTIASTAATNTIPNRPKSLIMLPLLLAVARVSAYLDKEPHYDGRFNSCDPG